MRIREDLLCDEDFRISSSMRAADLSGIVIDIQFGPRLTHESVNRHKKGCEDCVGSEKMCCAHCTFKTNNKLILIRHIQSHHK